MSVADAAEEDDMPDNLASTSISFEYFHSDEFVDDSESFYGPITTETTLHKGRHVNENANIDTDGDGIPDYLDEDDDNDGIPDIEDDDDDGDGILDFLEDINVSKSDDGSWDIPDTDNTKTFEAAKEKDTDGDGIPDSIDDDDDNDGIPDYLDDDDDGDGILDFLEEDYVAHEESEKETVAEEPSEPTEKDSDGDGIPDSIDEDDDNDGIPDYLDDDDDGDGILDFLEEDYVASVEHGGDDLSEQVADTGSDVDSAFSDVDSDGDGIPDYLDDDNDNDGIPDYLDDDDDGDGILDFLEEATGIFAAFGTEQPVSYPDTTYEVDISESALPGDDFGKDSDGDGIPDSVDEDDDNDGIPDYLDDDVDGDGIPDFLEDSETYLYKDYGAFVEEQQPVDESQFMSTDSVEEEDVEVKPVVDLNESLAPKIEPVFLADNLIYVGIDIDMVSDADNDGIPDYRDDDDDNDGIPDHLDIDTEVPPIAMRLVNGPKYKFNGEESLSLLLSRSRAREQEPEKQSSLFSGIFSKAMKTIGRAGDDRDETPSSPSEEADVSMLASVFYSFKKSILEEDEDSKH